MAVKPGSCVMRAESGADCESLMVNNNNSTATQLLLQQVMIRLLLLLLAMVLCVPRLQKLKYNNKWTQTLWYLLMGQAQACIVQLADYGFAYKARRETRTGESAIINAQKEESKSKSMIHNLYSRRKAQKNKHLFFYLTSEFN